jgi:hypothetical protein
MSYRRTTSVPIFARLTITLTALAIATWRDLRLVWSRS